jgi:ParB-like chromosome segregation protein Spo0J
MSAAELQELSDDIKQNKLQHPIVRDAEGRVLDGRNRLRDVRALGSSLVSCCTCANQSDGRDESH